MLQPAHQPRNQRQRRIDQGRIANSAGVFGHDSLQPRECRVRDPATMAEAVHDLIFYQRQQPHILRQYPKIVQASGPGEPGRVIGGQRKGTRRAIMIDDCPRGHRAQPLPDIPLVQRRFSCDLGARRHRHCGHGIEQARTVADTDHQRQRGLVQHVHHPLGELCRARGLSLSHPDPPHHR